MLELTANAAQPTIGALLRYLGTMSDRDPGAGCSGITPQGQIRPHHTLHKVVSGVYVRPQGKYLYRIHH